LEKRWLQTILTLRQFSSKKFLEKMFGGEARASLTTDLA